MLPFRILLIGYSLAIKPKHVDRLVEKTMNNSSEYKCRDSIFYLMKQHQSQTNNSKNCRRDRMHKMLGLQKIPQNLNSTNRLRYRVLYFFPKQLNVRIAY